MLSPSPPQPDSPHHSSNPLTHLIQNILSYDGNIMLAAIISLLLVILFVLLLHVYAKWFLAQARHRRTRSSVSVSHVLSQTRFHHFHSSTSTVETNSTQKGLEPSMIASIPTYVYVSKEHKNGLECVICLSLFEDEDVGRKLPKCGHVFHVECIDMWLHSHSSCPICRASVVVENRVLDCDVNLSEHDSELSDGLEIVVEDQNCENENVVSLNESHHHHSELSGQNDLEIENLATNESVSGCSSSSSSLSRASSLSGSLKRILSRNKSERKIYPSTIIIGNEAGEV